MITDCIILEYSCIIGPTHSLNWYIMHMHVCTIVSNSNINLQQTTAVTQQHEDELL